MSRPEGDQDHLVEAVTELARCEPGLNWKDRGFLDYDVVDSLAGTRGWSTLEPLSVGNVRVPTTLDRVSSDFARRLIARAYLGTWLTTLFLKREERSWPDVLADLPDRLERIVGGDGGTE